MCGPILCPPKKSPRPTRGVNFQSAEDQGNRDLNTEISEIEGNSFNTLGISTSIQDDSRVPGTGIVMKENLKENGLPLTEGKDISKGPSVLIGNPKGKLGQSSRLNNSERQRWASFAAGMVSEEDARIFNNDLRNRNKRRLIELDPENEEQDIRSTWEFGKVIGLQGNDSDMEGSLKKLDGQVSIANPLDKELMEDVSL